MTGFSGIAVRAGMRACAPLLLGILPFGLVCGIVSQQHGLSFSEAVLMSAAVYGGSAQLLALGQWTHPAPVAAAGLAALVINLRLALMGPVLTPWLSRVRGWRLWGSLFVMADQNWAISLAEQQAGRYDAGFLFGSGALMWLLWVAATAAGHGLGAALQLPSDHPLFFTALAVFVAILVSMWRGRGDVLPWAVAAAVSIVVQRLLPGGSWHIVAGALGGSGVAVLRDARR